MREAVNRISDAGAFLSKRLTNRGPLLWITCDAIRAPADRGVLAAYGPLETRKMKASTGTRAHAETAERIRQNDHAIGGTVHQDVLRFAFGAGRVSDPTQRVVHLACLS